MQFEDREFYHVYNRGNQKQAIFFNRGNYIFFAEKMFKELSPYADIVAYCLMPNHFHILLQVRPGSEGLTRKTLNWGIAILLRSYTRAIQKQEDFTGSLFQQKTKARLVLTGTDIAPCEDLSICKEYIHQNPVKAGLVRDPGEWEFSSYNFENR